MENPFNSPRPQRGQGRSDLFSKENLRFSPPPTPSPTKMLPARPPPLTHVGWTKNPVQRALKFSGFVGVQLHGSIFVENRLLACLTCAQPATRHPASGPSVHETGLAHPATRPSSRRAQPATHLSGPGASQSMPATRPAPLPAGTSRLSPACQGQACLTCLRLASGQRPVSRV